MEGTPVQEEASVEDELCETCRQKETEILREKIQKIIDEKEKVIARLKEDIETKKEKMRSLVECRQSLSETWGKVLWARSKVRLMRRTYEKERSSQQQELDELRTLQRSNNRRDDRLARVRSKDLHKKERAAQQEYADTRKLAVSQMVELQVSRRCLITEVFRGVFPIEVEPLSEADAGEEDYQDSVLIDCDSVLEVDDGWMLSGVHTHSMPKMHIVSASMPSDGNYSAYLKAASEKKKARVEASQQGVPAVTGSADKSVHPFNNSYMAIPAGLVYTALFVDVIANTLDQPLPYPLSRRAAIGEYGNPGRRKRDFLNSVAKLDDNILYLCFAQSVPLTALTPGHTLQNLLALVTHTQLGRSGAFECYPNLMRYRGRHGTPIISSMSPDLEDVQPPAVLYTSDQSNQVRHKHSEFIFSDSDSDSNEDNPGNYYSNEQDEKFDEMYDWEYLEPNIKELRLFEEQQMRSRLAEKAGSDLTDARQVANEMDVQRQRLRRLDYDSTYLDYTSAIMSSTRTQTTSHNIERSESARLAGSDERGASGGRTDESSGIFGTLSSLWTSAFGNRPSSS